MVSEWRFGRGLSIAILCIAPLGTALEPQVGWAQGAPTDPPPSQPPARQPPEQGGADAAPQPPADRPPEGGGGGGAGTGGEAQGGAPEGGPGPTAKPLPDKDAATKKKAETAPTAPPEPPKEPEHKGSFEFGSYGRVVAAVNGDGGPGHDADIVSHGSRMDEDNYAEAELRREDDWGKTGIHTNVVVTLAIASPVFHWSGDFELNAAIRNLYLEARDIGVKGLAAWAGSRMVRGDDIYLLDWWPLDNLNLLGAGVSYAHEVGTAGQLVVGATQPNVPFFKQTVERPAPLDQFGSVSVPLLDRQKLIGALRLSHNQKFGDRDKPGPGVKAVLYGEGYTLPEGKHEPEPGAELEQLPSDGGFSIGGQVTLYSGKRDTFVHVFARYSSNLAAYGQFTAPGQLNLEKTTSGAREIVVATAGNAEIEFFGVMMGAYFRSFRDASEALNFEDVDEGAVVLRPTFFLGDIAGISLEGTFEMAQRGVLHQNPDAPEGAPEGPAIGSIWRVGIIPYISPAGRGDYVRPHLRAIYNLAVRDETARQFYPVDHPFREHKLEHFFGLGAEWWFNSSSYGF
ncbi:MAG: hypothetical protein HOW73_34215 [Polyangiaceae bacterium]|nr:hypothetical protein [Polyangiaceae bacterium]